MRSCLMFLIAAITGAWIAPAAAALSAPISGTGEIGADEAWLLGLFIGDGHVQASGSAQVMVGDPGVRAKLNVVVASFGRGGCLMK